MARLESVCPKLRKGEWIIENDELYYSIDGEPNRGPYAAESRQIGKFLNGIYSIQEMFLALYKQGLHMSFTYTLDLIGVMAKDGVIQNPEIFNGAYERFKEGIATEPLKSPKNLKEQDFTKERLRSYIQKTCIVPPGDINAIDRILDHSRIVYCNKGSVLIAQGSEGTEVCLLMAGKLGVYRDEFGKKHFVANLDPVCIFGESPAFLNKKRNAEILALQNSWVLAIRIQDLLKDKKSNQLDGIKSMRTRLLVNQILSCAPLFRGVPAETMNHFINLCESKEVGANEEVIRQGEVGSSFYFVLDGHLLVKKNDSLIARLKKGDYFGEIGALTKAPRTASVISEESCTLLVLELSQMVPVLCKNFAMALEIEGTAMKRFDELQHAKTKISQDHQARMDLERTTRDYSLSDLSFEELDFSTFTGLTAEIDEKS